MGCQLLRKPVYELAELRSVEFLLRVRFGQNLSVTPLRFCRKTRNEVFFKLDEACMECLMLGNDGFRVEFRIEEGIVHCFFPARVVFFKVNAECFPIGNYELMMMLKKRNLLQRVFQKIFSFLFFYRNGFLKKIKSSENEHSIRKLQRTS